MIPYSALMLKFKWNNGKTLEVRALELGPDFLTFRVSSKRKADFLSEKPACLLCCFLNFRQREYITADISDFVITLRNREDAEDESGSGLAENLFDVFELRSSDAAFLEGVKKVFDDYGAYIVARLQYDEQDLLKVLTGHEIKEEYEAGLNDWKLAKVSGCSLSGALSSCQIAIAADNRLYQEKFLAMDREEYITWYWKQNALNLHDISKVHVSHIYFGSQFCVHLLPESDKVAALIDKALEWNLKPVICFPPMSEGTTDIIKSVITAACIQPGWDREFVINDIGTALMIREMSETGVIDSDNLHLTAGVLLNKRKKDPRAEYAFTGKALVDAEHGCSLNNTLYLNYLKKLGISRLSYECGIKKQDVVAAGGVLHLPLYQTNTASRCTLQSYIEDGSRSRLEYKDSCPGYCSDYAFVYPNDSGIVGIGNSLFGFAKGELSNVSLLNELIDAGIERLVIRL